MSVIPPPQVYFVPQVIPQPEGTVLIKPGKPRLGRESLTINEAARRFGISRATISRLFNAKLIEGERPGPRKTIIFADSLTQHLVASRDPEYWENEDRRRRYRAAISGSHR